MNTNGTLLDEEMAEMLLDSGIDFVSIDCDGFSKEIYERIRINGNRDVVYANIEYFLNRKHELGLVKPIIEVKTMEMDENRDEVDRIMEYWRRKGAWTTKRRLITWGGKIEDIRYEIDNQRIACGNAVGTMAITWDGKVVNCVMDVDAEYICGDVNYESVQEIWMRRNQNLVKKHMGHQWNDIPNICKTCMDWAIIGEERFDDRGNSVSKSYDYKEEML